MDHSSDSRPFKVGCGRRITLARFRGRQCDWGHLKCQLSPAGRPISRGTATDCRPRGGYLTAGVSRGEVPLHARPRWHAGRVAHRRRDGRHCDRRQGTCRPRGTGRTRVISLRSSGRLPWMSGRTAWPPTPRRPPRRREVAGNGAGPARQAGRPGPDDGGGVRDTFRCLALESASTDFVTMQFPESIMAASCQAVAWGILQIVGRQCHVHREPAKSFK